MKKIVLITGVAGGIGAATARAFSDDGWMVFGVDRKKGSRTVAVEQYISADVAKPDAWKHIFSEIRRSGGRLDALVNNAAVQICKPLMKTTVGEWDRIMASNVRSVFLASRLAFPLLKQSTRAIINVSSVHALATSQTIAAYAARKGALVALTRAMALEFGNDGIRVNSILPGAIDTPMLHAGLVRGSAKGKSVDELLRRLGRKHVLGRIGTPREIAEAILFLAWAGACG